MRVRVNNIILPPEADFGDVRQQAAKKLKTGVGNTAEFRIVRQSVDARKKQVRLVYSAELTLPDKTVLPNSPDIRPLPPEIPSAPLKSTLRDRPVVVGTGPCGLFCALTLARAGAPPLILERGAEVNRRTELVNRYWQEGKLNISSNVQFGEGGAGTFSDGKLTTRINDPRSALVLKEFHRFGADEDILYKAKPHIGTDVLRCVIQSMRRELLALGCEIRFETALTGLDIQDGRLRHILTSHEEVIPCSHLILAIGHSARDTYEMLLRHGVSMVQKPFSVGVRIEHLQAELDQALYGKYAGHPRLGAAEYQLSHRVGNDACYSFCMCPGGIVVAAASEQETIVTNGMSRRARNEINANAALCVNVDGRYFADNHPLAGVYFQRELERRAYVLTGGKGAPIQTVGGFMKGITTEPGKIQPSYTGKTLPADLTGLFPQPVAAMLRQGLTAFGRKIEGYNDPEALLTGPETRTSAPIRLLRGDDCQSISTGGVYPSGEGAGYAGGIVSAAVDGIRVAEKILTESL